MAALRGAKNPAARLLGKVGVITLAEAREKPREWIKMIERGDDPRVVERRARDAKQENNAKTFGVVFEDYLKRKVKKLRKAKDVEREMRKDCCRAGRINRYWRLSAAM
jgi:hypothetical protein